MSEEIKLYKINPKEKLILPFYEGGLFCGNPSENDYKPVYIDFMDMLTNYKQDEFIAVVQGDSMKDMGYMPGDICIVSQNVSPKEGSIVIACIDGRNTMKLYHRDKKNGKIYLIPANKDYEPIVIDEEQKTCIQGVVTRCLKNAHDGVSIVKAVMKKNEEKKLKLSKSINDIKTAITTLFEENLFSNSKQWYAVYKVLTTYKGFPHAMSEFCAAIDNLELENIQFQCKYNNWRKVPTEIRLPQNIDLWDDYLCKATDKEKNLIIVAKRLKELLKIE